MSTIVLLHAFPVGPAMWEPQIAALSGHELAIPRLYGRGTSIDGWARQLLRELDGELVPVGASMGGYCALALARRAPERLCGLVLAGSRASADTAAGVSTREQTIEILRRGGFERIWATMEPTLFGPNADPAQLAEAHATAAAQSADELVAATAAMRDRPDLSDVVRTLPCPLLVTTGEFDFVRPEASTLSALAPQGELAVIEGAGHLASFERPDLFNPILLDFLARAI